MKRNILIIVGVMIILMVSAFEVSAETDYSYLDDMTINQLKELDAEIHKRIPYSVDPSSVSDTVQSENTSIDFSPVGEWFLNDGSRIYFVFYKDGTGETGKRVNGGRKKDSDYFWSINGDYLTFSYSYNGKKMSAVYEIKKDNDQYVMVFTNDSTRILKRTEETEVPEFVGIWKCQLNGSVSTMTISENGSAKIKVGSNTYNCTWTQSGSKLTFTQNGKPITGTYNGKTIVLNFAGIRMVFKR